MKGEDAKEEEDAKGEDANFKNICNSDKSCRERDAKCPRCFGRQALKKAHCALNGRDGVDRAR